MVFKNPPTTFDRVIFAMVGRVIGQHDFKIIFVRLSIMRFMNSNSEHSSNIDKSISCRVLEFHFSGCFNE